MSRYKMMCEECGGDLNPAEHRSGNQHLRISETFFCPECPAIIVYNSVSKLVYIKLPK